MSFVRVPRRTTKAGSHSRKRPKKKPEWDDTNTDLTVYKATPEEVNRRKVVHQSKNVDLVQADKLTKKINRARSRQNAPDSAKKKQVPLLREMLYDENQLRDVLAKSDRAMSVVRDMFGDDPKRYRGLPSVTIAPNLAALDGSLPTGLTLEGPSKLDVLSDTVMDKSALNDVNRPDTDTDDDADGADLQYKPVLDLKRFRQFLEAEQEQAKRDDQLTKAKDAQAVAKRLEAQMALLGLNTPDSAGGGDLAASPPDGSFLGDKTPTQTPRMKAMNDTEKCERTRSRLTHSAGDRPANDAGDHSNTLSQTTGSTSYNMDDLKRVLETLEGNLAAYERQTGRVEEAPRTHPESFSGYTMSLVNAVSKLTVYLKESEARLRAECTLREQLTEDVEQLNAVIDTLTTDLMSIQEDYTSLQDEFYKFKLVSQQELYGLKASLISFGIPVSTNTQEDGSKSKTNVVKTLQEVPQPRVPLSQGPPRSQPKPRLPHQPHVPTENPATSHNIGVSPDQLAHSQNIMEANLQMQMIMQQMLMSKSNGLPLQSVPSERDRSQRQEDTMSLDQHPLSSTLTSQSTVRSVASTGRSQQYQPPVNQPNHFLPATLLSPPRQSNSPRDPGKADSRFQGHSSNQHQTMPTHTNQPVAKLQQPVPNRNQPVLSQSQPVPNQTSQNQNHQQALANLYASLRASQGGQFKPVPVDNESNPDTAQQPTDLYFKSNQAPSQLMQGLPGQGPAPGQAQFMLGNGQVYGEGPAPGQAEFMLGNGQVYGEGPAPGQAQFMLGNGQVYGDGGAAERVEMNRELITKQIEELNKQHAEAKTKLQKLFIQQQNAVKDLSQDDMGHHISPSISPIPGGSESDTGGTIISDMSSLRAAAAVPKPKAPAVSGRMTASKGITITLPHMDMFNWSDTSTPTLSTSKTQSRLSEDSPVPVLAVSPDDGSQTPYKDNQKVNPNSAFFALATHVGS